jgi:hypothetical protein
MPASAAEKNAAEKNAAEKSVAEKSVAEKSACDAGVPWLQRAASHSSRGRAACFLTMLAALLQATHATRQAGCKIDRRIYRLSISGRSGVTAKVPRAPAKVDELPRVTQSR